MADSKRPKILTSPRPSFAKRRLEVPKEFLDPNFHFRWVDRNEASGRILYHLEDLDYVFVTKGDSKAPVGDQGIPGNAIIAGDVVLMKCPMDTYLARKRQMEQYNRQRVGQPMDRFRNQVRDSGLILEDRSQSSETTLEDAANTANNEEEE